MYVNTNPHIVPNFNVSEYVSTRHDITIMGEYRTLTYKVPSYTIQVLQAIINIL